MHDDSNVPKEMNCINIDFYEHTRYLSIELVICVHYSVVDINVMNEVDMITGHHLRLLV